MSRASSPGPDSAQLSLGRLADQCVMCGLCLPHCPTYARDRVEGSGPRGRIALVRALESAAAELTPRAETQLDGCLSCLRCESVCPAKVPYGTLIDGARARWLAPGRRLRFWLWLAARPHGLGMLLRLASGWRRLGGWLPRVARRAVAGLAPRRADAQGSGRRRAQVYVLPGCSGQVLEASALAAFGQLLTTGGWPWQVATAVCCGALHQHAGLPSEAGRQADRHARLLSGLPAVSAAALLAWASGCQRHLTTTAPSVRSVLDWAAIELPMRLRMIAVPAGRVAVWTPCSLATQVGAGEAILRLARAVEGAEVVAVRAHGCCGAAGFRQLLDPERTDPLTDAVLDEAVATGATQLVTANPGCVHALRARALERDLRLPVVQIFEWLAGLRLTLRG